MAGVTIKEDIMARVNKRVGQWEVSWNQTTWREWKGLIATFMLLVVITICGIMFSGCEAAIMTIHHKANYGNLDNYCSREYGNRSFFNSYWDGCVVPGMSEETCKANGGELRSLASRCIIPVQ